MDESTFTIDGLDALAAQPQLYEDAMNRMAVRVAQTAANAMVVEARGHLQRPSPGTKGPHEHREGESMVEAIEIVEDLAKNQIRVLSNAPAQYPANLTIWREYGTEHAAARPYMHPALKTVQPSLERDFADGAEQVAKELSS